MSVTKHLPDGTTVVLTAEEFEAELAAQKALIESASPRRPTRPAWHVPVEPVPPPFEISKLKLRRALRAAGVEAQYDAFIAALPDTARVDFQEATVLSSDDPDLVAAMPLFAAAVGKTEAELRVVLNLCRAT